MKLSEAIREGSKHGNQLRGRMVHGRDRCALGAAMLSMLITDQKVLFQVLPQLMEPREIRFHVTGLSRFRRKYWNVKQYLSHVPSWEERFRFPNLGSAIMLMNDSGYWTREEIADWLEESGYDFDIPPLEVGGPFEEWRRVEQLRESFARESEAECPIRRWGEVITNAFDRFAPA